MSSDRTIVIPRPQGGRCTPQRKRSPVAQQPTFKRPERAQSSGTLFDQVIPVLRFAAQLRTSTEYSQAGQLWAFFEREIAAIVDRARVLKVRRETCTLIEHVLYFYVDECVLQTDWARTSPWGRQTLCQKHCGHSVGGERFFSVLEVACRAPRQYEQGLHLMLLCLNLGYEGKFVVSSFDSDQAAREKKQQLDAYRARAAACLRKLGWRNAGSLSIDANPQQAQASRRIPLIPILLVLLVALGGEFAYLRYKLHQESEPVFESIAGIHVGTKAALASGSLIGDVALQLPPWVEDLSVTFADEIKQGSVVLQPGEGEYLLRMGGADLFEPGKAVTNAANKKLILQIAEALREARGTIVVAGHTDDSKIGSGPWASNWSLSEARARHVARLLEDAGVLKAKVTSIGKGASEPIAGNETKLGRRKNRRVEIIFPVAMKKGGAS